ncbi:MAG TPA: TetR/AcrR family transcriptional regulator, partial [Deltaproteobacteria bacterium]|nr:TetR/AcrR family transcriptional regulator [Deltaproteobacteria bacterium]
MEGKRRYKPDVRKAQIIEVTKRLILEKGLAWATVTRITKSLNISKAALYYHFKNRREILLAILKEVLEGIPVIGEIDDVLAFIRRCSISFF